MVIQSGPGQLSGFAPVINPFFRPRSEDEAGNVRRIRTFTGQDPGKQGVRHGSRANCSGGSREVYAIVCLHPLQLHSHWPDWPSRQQPQSPYRPRRSS